jgi:Xaa-Pro aminopeptidase
MINETLAEKVIYSISTEELERRWTAVRQVMKEKKVDFLVVQNNNDYLGGYVKWFTDLPANHGYPITVIFPAADNMTVISHGSSDPTKPSPPEWMLRGVKKRISTPIMLSLNYTCHFEGKKVVEELRGYQNAHICLVNEGAMTVGLVNYIRKHLTSATFVDITDDIDWIKSIKSPEEIQRVKVSAYLHDEAMRACIESIRPGMREFELAAIGRQSCRMHGSEQQFILIGSAPAGNAFPYNAIHAMNRELRKGDQVGILIEAADAAGYYTHLHRIICLGSVPEGLQKQYDLALEAQNLTLDLLRPGADPVEILKANNEFMIRHGYPEETRIYAHAQGYDLLERPSLQPGETMKIAAGMNIAVHPGVLSKNATATLCDNYMVTATGASECLHKTPKNIFVV